MDIGSAVGRAQGVSETQLLELANYRDSDAFDETERMVLELATHMSGAPVSVPTALRESLRKRFDDAELVELAGSIAWENFRARFNRALGIAADGFCEGAFCALPAKAAALNDEAG
ncbi:MAG: hypothetical protein IPI67_09045 [Myxococcales bacterium]|nr:hypothetical protein [Myxococcales bacterium]